MVCGWFEIGAGQMPVLRLIHRFEDRVLLLATGRCAMCCRFCFRKREWADGADLADLSESELAAAAACGRLILAGVSVVNRNVLLRGVNDDPAVLEELFRRLIAIRVKPHYLLSTRCARFVTSPPAWNAGWRFSATSAPGSPCWRCPPSPSICRKAAARWRFSRSTAATGGVL